jgi:hypothetical protein
LASEQADIGTETKQGQSSKDQAMGDSGIHGHKGLTSPSKSGAALGMWGDLTVFAVRGGQTVLALGDLGQKGLTNVNGLTNSLVDPATDILVARKRAMSPTPQDPGRTWDASNDKTNSEFALSPNAANSRNTQPPSEALAILELAFGLGKLTEGDALLDEAALNATAADDIGKPVIAINSTPNEVPLDPLSDAACAMNFDAALKAALAADAAALATELAAAHMAAVPLHGSALAALHDGSSHPTMFST